MRRSSSACSSDDQPAAATTELVAAALLPAPSVRAVAAYLIVYSALVLGALLALWQGGVLNRISGLLLATILAVAAGFGVLLAVTSRPPRQVDDTDPA